MSKAEDFGYSKYPKSKKGVLYDLARNNIIEGYRQAEKDLELTWEDMLRIDEITSQVFKDSDTCQTEVIYQEVLKRFKNFKERKENGTK